MHDVDLLISMAIHCPTSNLVFSLKTLTWYWFNSSQLIRVDKFLIIKDTTSKIVEVIRQPCMNRVYQLFP